MATNVVRGIIVLILAASVVVVGALVFDGARQFHREGMARLRAARARRRPDPYLMWIRALAGDATKGGRS